MTTINSKNLYFNDDDFTLLRGDSFKILRSMEKESVDMI